MKEKEIGREREGGGGGIGGGGRGGRRSDGGIEGEIGTEYSGRYVCVSE